MKNPFYELGFPTYEFRLKTDSSKNHIFDEIRRKWLVCTPEEWVRQNLIKFLISNYGFARNMISIEKSLTIANRNYRFDILVYDKSFNPLLIIECKAPTVSLNQEVFDQVWNYNYEVSAPYFLITNGISFVMGKYSTKSKIEFFDTPKNYEELCQNI